MSFSCFLALTLTVATSHGATLVNVTTGVGEIIGVVESVTLRDGAPHTVNVFRGIPYAEPPVGHLRFAKPRPKSEFSQPFSALHFGPACPQTRAVMGNVSEDCLHLNVYVPRTDQQASLPVIVWIHGGAFVSGEARDIPGEILAAFGGVIVVTVNFRLGALGFLATDDETAPGNFGLWDQRLALQWVKTHIEHFGGDSGRITLAGTLSGGICVTFQALYPPNGRLFQRIIPETGTAIGVAGYHVRGKAFAKTLAEELGCEIRPTHASDDIVACLRDKPAEDIARTTVRPGRPFALTWTPVVDGDFIQRDPLLLLTWPPSDNPLTTFRSMDAMFGTTSSDGSVSLSFFAGPIAASVNESLTSGTSDQLFEKIVQAMLPRVDVEELGEVQEQAVLQEYKHWEDPESPRDNGLNLVQLLTDHGFFIPSAVFTRNHAAGNSSGNTFMYEFNQRGNTPLPYPWLEGSLHGDHNAFVFGLPVGDEGSTMTQLNFTRRVMTYWSNFVKTGNPNTPASQDVEWPPFTVDGESYLHLEADRTSARRRCRARRTAFWLDYLPKLRASFSAATDDCARNKDDTSGAVNFFPSLNLWRMKLIVCFVFTFILIC